MTQTIRDVLIKIGIESNTRGFKAPDWRQQQQQVEKYKRAVEDLAGSIRNMPRAGGGGGFGGAPGSVGPGARTRGAHSPAPQVEQYFGDVDIGVSRYGNQFGRQKRFTEQITGGDEFLLRRSDTMAKVERDRARATEEQAKRERALTEIENQRSEALNGLAMGAMKLVRGMAFVSAANDAEYQQMLKLMAQAQGYFDLVSGGIDLYKNLGNLKKASAAATLVEAAAENTLAGARTRSAAASGAGGLLGRMGGVFGVATRIAAPLALAYGVGKVAQYGISEYSGSGRMTKETAELFSRMNTRNAERQNIISDSRFNIDQFLGRFSDRQEFGSASREYGLRTGKLTTAEAMRQLDQETADSLFQISRGKGGKQVGDARTSLLENAQTAQASAELIKKREEERLRLLESEEASLRKQWETAQGLLRTTQETLRTEQDRYASMEERFGRLAPAQQGRLRDIAARRARGEALSRADIEALDQAGTYGGETVSAYFRQKGREGGSAQIADVFGDNAGLRQAQQSAAHAAQVFSQTNEEFVDAITKLVKLRKTTEDTLVELVKETYELERKLAVEVERLSRESRDNSASETKAQGLGGKGMRFRL